MASGHGHYLSSCKLIHVLKMFCVYGLLECFCEPAETREARFWLLIVTKMRSVVLTRSSANVGEQCSAAACLGMLKFFILSHQADFDVVWCKGASLLLPGLSWHANLVVLKQHLEQLMHHWGKQVKCSLACCLQEATCVNAVSIEL